MHSNYPSAIALLSLSFDVYSLFEESNKELKIEDKINIYIIKDALFKVDKLFNIPRIITSQSHNEEETMVMCCDMSINEFYLRERLMKG